MTENPEELVQVGENKYPKWAVERAKEVIVKHGGSLESTVKSVLQFTKAKRKGKQVDPSAPGRGFSHSIGGYVVIRGEQDA